MKEYSISWWNLENLFDVENSPNRADWLQKELKHELKGWNANILQRKIEQLKKIIEQMNSGKGPDILGVCEVENKQVLEKLVLNINLTDRNYEIAYHETQDQRGIDIAFIYDENILQVENQFSYFVLKRTATRDIVQVNFRTLKGNQLILIGNHWPSRKGGESHSEPYRIIAAETLAYWNKKIIEICGNDVAIIIAGDFNDEPYSRSIQEYALSIPLKKKVIYSRIPRFYNLMYKFLSQGIGSYYYNYFPSLFDQFWVSKGFITHNSAFSLARNDSGDLKVEVLMFEEMNSKGRYPDPIRFGRPSKALNLKGFSDHYPIELNIEEK